MNYTGIEDIVRARMQGIETGILDVYINKVLREFFIASGIWKEACVITIVEGVYSYDVEVEGDLVKLVDVSLSSAAKSLFITDRKTKQVCFREKSIDRRLALSKQYDGKEFTFLYHICPESNSKDFPELLIVPYEDGIVSGVIASLSKIPNRPYTDFQIASEEDYNYNKHLTRARQLVRREGVRWV